MHEIQTTADDVCGVGLSVCLSVTRLDSASCTETAEGIKLLIEVNTLGGPGILC